MGQARLKCLEYMSNLMKNSFFKVGISQRYVACFLKNFGKTLNKFRIEFHISPKKLPFHLALFLPFSGSISAAATKSFFKKFVRGAEFILRKANVADCQDKFLIRQEKKDTSGKCIFQDLTNVRINFIFQT